jgi:Tfp pilus assembly protein PilF
VPSLKSVRPLDAVIAVVALLVLVLAGVLGWSVWSQNYSAKNSTPIARTIADLEKNITKHPRDIKLRMQLAQTYTIAGQDSDATEQYKQVLALQKNYVPAISGLGFIASRQQDWKAAEGYWRKAVGLMEGDPAAPMSKTYETANFYLATTLLEQKKYEDAIGYFKEALRVNSSASDTHYLLAAAYEGIGADEEAKSELETAIAFDPKMPEANYRYGLILLAEGNEADAAQHFRIAVDEAPNRKEPQTALKKLGSFAKRMAAATKLANTDPKAALDEVRVAVALEPGDTKALMLLASLYEKTGEKSMAADTYRNVIAHDANNAEAKAALERVTDDK